MINQIEHPYHCPVCHDGTVGKELWEMLYGVNLGLHNCGQSNPKHNDLKIWIGKRLDAIDSHGCSSCWSDSRSCTCKEEKLEMAQSFLSELPKMLTDSFVNKK